MGSEWGEYKLGDIFIASNQGVNTTTENVVYSDSGIKVVRAKNVLPYKVDFHDVVYVDSSTYRSLKDSVKPNCGDILFTNIGSRLGSAALIEKEERFIIAWNVFRIVPKKDTVDSKYLTYFFNNKATREYIRALDSSSTMPFVSGKVLRNIDIVLPPLPEQKAIAHVLGALDDRIELNRRMNDTLESMAQALFKSWFVDFDPVIDNALASGKEIPAELSERAAARAALGDKRQPLPAEIRTLFPDEFIDSAELGWIPKGWEVGSLADVCFVKGGYAFKGKDFTTSGFPVIKIKNINSDRTVNITDVQHIPEDIASKVENFLLSSGDLLMAMTGATVGKFGLLIPEIEKKYLLNQRVAKFHPIDTISKKIWFVYCCLSQKNVIDYIVNVAHGSAQPNVSAGTIMKTSILKAGDEVVSVFNSMVDGNFTKMLSNGEAVQTLSNLRDTLLPKLLSGEVRIRNAGKLVEASEMRLPERRNNLGNKEANI
ncbi:MAG: restriction endonuclease subunit S [Desulfobulbaceae bacterium]|jgi:type I restriction enzyme S subunit|nr:restriction endonuclease subunit S [Desulfobulbaceae bacterium]